MRLKIPICFAVFFILIIVGQTRSDTTYVATISMNATINAWISITPSEALSQGIQFGTITPGSLENNATNNTNGLYGGSAYNITIDSLTNTNVDFYNRANDLISGSNILQIGNVTHNANSTSNNGTVIDPVDSIALTTSMAKLGVTGACDNLSPGSNCWIAFWLDAPQNIIGGNYATTYYFCAEKAGSPQECL